FGLPVVRSDAAEELGPASLRIDPADVLLPPNGSAVVALVVPEVEVPPTVEITDPGPATDFHFIPLSRGMPSRGEVRFQEGSMKLLPFALRDPRALDPYARTASRRAPSAARTCRRPPAPCRPGRGRSARRDRKSTRLNSSHVS